jgi:hypothetical protein
MVSLITERGFFMDAQFFLRGCWKADFIESNHSEKSIKKDLDLIAELLKIDADPDTILLMVAMTIYKGACAKSLKSYLDEKAGENSYPSFDKAGFLRALYVIESVKELKPITRYLMTIATIDPGSLKKFMDEKEAREEQKMTPLLGSMTPSPGASFAQAS